MRPLGPSAAISGAGSVVAQNDRIDVALANTPRDDLGVLRAKIQNDDLFCHCSR